MDTTKKSWNNLSLEDKTEIGNLLVDHLNRDCHTLSLAASLVAARYSRYSWLSPGILLKAYENDKDFRKLIEPELAIGKQIMTDLAEETLMSKLRQGDARSAELVLKTLGSTRGYSEKQEINHTVNTYTEATAIDAARRMAFLIAKAEHEGKVIDHIPDNFLTRQ
jgi:hypothetical protein